MSARAVARSVPQSAWGREHRARQPEAVRRHRQKDRRRLRSMATAVVGAGLAVILILGVVGLRVQQVRLSYRLDALRGDQVRIAREFVPGGRGAAALDRPSVVAERPVPRDVGVR